MTQLRFRNTLATVFLLLGVHGAWAQCCPKTAACPLFGNKAAACPEATSCPKCCPKEACAAPCKAACAQCPLCQKLKESQIERRLSQAINVDFKDMPLKNALEDLHDLTGLNMVLDKPALEKDGICLDRPVTMHLEQVTARAVLSLVLRQAGLAYVIKDEVVLVTTAAGARGKLVSRTYPVADLILPLPSSPVPCQARCASINLAAAPMKSAAGEQTVEDQLIKIITSTIQPESWSDLGGPGTIDYWPMGMALVVNSPADVQEQVADFLAALRRLMDEDGLAAAVPADGSVAAAPPPAVAMPPLLPPAPASYVMPVPHMAPTYLYTPEPAGVYQPAPPVAVPCSMPPAGEAPTPTPLLRVVAEKDQAKMEIQSGNMCLTCETLSLNMTDGKIKLCVRDGQIRLCGPHFQAVADRLTGTGAEDRVVLEGHVRVQYADDHTKVTADTADRVVIGLKDGRLEISPKSPPADRKKEAEAVFQFWQGYFR